MSKYNHQQSIPIESIPKDEIARAIKEWAEGDEAVERLLWACYNNNVKTNGSHVGARPYITFADNSDFDAISTLLETTMKIKGSQILITANAGNPFGGKDWYKPNIGIGFNVEYQDEADEIFNKLSNNLENKNNTGVANKFIDLYNFFNGKGSNLVFRFRHRDDDSCVFYVESGPIDDKRFKYYDQLIKENSFETSNSEMTVYDSRRHEWKIESNNLDDIITKINIFVDNFTSKFSYPAPSSEDEVLGFNELADFKRKTLSKEEFDLWLMKKEKEIMNRYNERKEKESQK